MVILSNQNLYFKIQCKKKQKQNYNSFQDIFDITYNSHNNLNMKITTKICTSFVYSKLQSKYNKKFHVLLKCNQIARLNLWHTKTKSINFATKYLHLFPYFKTMCLKNEFHFPRTPTFGQSPSHHQHDSKPNKNSKFKPLMSNDQSLSVMPCTSKNNVICLFL